MDILLFTEHAGLTRALKERLENRRLKVHAVKDAHRSSPVFLSNTWALIILCPESSGFDGIELCSLLRKKRLFTPVIFLSARTDDSLRLRALASGADYFLVAPFDFEELFVKVDILLKRKKRLPVTTFGCLRMDFESRKVFQSGRNTQLNAKEFDLLEFFIHHPNTVFTRTSLLKYVWSEKNGLTEHANTVDVHIHRLRKKIGDENGHFLKTIHRVGYKFSAS